MNVGLISDTHMPGTISKLWPSVFQAFETVDCILHAGDLHISSVIDELDKLAPTYACMGNGDIGQNHQKLRDNWLIECAGLRVGLVHQFPSPARADVNKLNSRSARIFTGVQPDILIYGHTHHALVKKVAGRLYINPGSATLPDNQSTRYGTIGVLNINPSNINVELHQLSEEGIKVIESFSFNADITDNY